MKTSHCTCCGNLVFFENVSCNQCCAVLGFVPSLREICAFEGDDEIGWKTTVFTKNRARLIQHDAVIEFFNEVLALAQKKNWLSGEHFSVDGTLIGRGQATRASCARMAEMATTIVANSGAAAQQRDASVKTDPDAKLYRKGKTGSELRYMGHTLVTTVMAVVSATVSIADGHAERGLPRSCLTTPGRQRSTDTEITVGADKGYDAQEFIEACLEMKMTPHVAQNTSGRRSAVPDAIACSHGFAVSQQSAS